VRTDDISEEELEREKEIYRAMARKEGRPENVFDRIVEGRVKKYCSEVCLLEQPYVRDDQKTVGELLREAVAKLGENILIRRFVRYQLGEQS
jgi:elongation factor Ts